MENTPSLHKENENKTAVSTDTKNINLPFVNDECGDTMWDEVLKEAEERLAGIVTQKPGNNKREL